MSEKSVSNEFLIILGPILNHISPKPTMAVYFTFGANAGILTGVLKKNGAIAMNSLSLRIERSHGESIIPLGAGQMTIPMDGSLNPIPDVSKFSDFS